MRLIIDSRTKTSIIDDEPDVATVDLQDDEKTESFVISTIQAEPVSWLDGILHWLFPGRW